MKTTVLKVVPYHADILCKNIVISFGLTPENKVREMARWKPGAGRIYNHSQLQVSKAEWITMYRRACAILKKYIEDKKQLTLEI